MTFQTEFAFTLPRGYLDAQHELHREGTMRLATASDEILPLKDPRVQANPGYLAVILLSRVVTRLGTLEPLNPKIIEGLFAADFAFLESLYRRINAQGHNRIGVTCPECSARFETEVADAGELSATP
ncbi:phage tail assembly protein [Pseudorhodoferax sp.]|uniref:phage tail assembly protein n=1 Tax=Pseudorhodoferax sp. TaxID=1993553 RepID=UPI0039E56711